MTPHQLSDSERENLRQISRKLLGLHKLLLDGERTRFEQANGPISSPGEFLHLVLEHPQFEWLRRLSGLIVQIDEFLSPRSKSGLEDASSAKTAVRGLLIPEESGSGFQRSYWIAIQGSPDILIAHRELISLLKKE